MTEGDGHEQVGISRRTFAGMGAAAAAIAALPGVALAGPASATARLAAGGDLGAAALSPVNPALTYVGLDAFAFTNDSLSTAAAPVDGRIYQDDTGVQPRITPGRMSASLLIPAGSTIHQLNVAYQGSPILEIWQRSMTTPVPYAPAFQQTTIVQSGPSTITFDLTTPITVAQASTLAVRFFFSAGDSVLGVTVGYLPPAQSFLPFSGPTPRVLDTRLAGGKLVDGEERVITLGFVGARGAVLNLTVTGTEGNGGFVAVYPANLAWPGNSSINWFGAGQDLANGVITAMDATGSIKIRGGANPTHVVIDRIGWLI